MTECEYSSYVVYYVTSLANALYYPIIQSALWCGNVATLTVEAKRYAIIDPETQGRWGGGVL